MAEEKAKQQRKTPKPKEDKPVAETEAVFTWNGWVNTSKKLRANPDFPFKHGDKLVVRLVPSSTGHNLVVAKANGK